MSESLTTNLQAFQPYLGGQGVRLAVTATSSRAAIPGLEGGREDGDRRRVLLVMIRSSLCLPFRVCFLRYR